jgi:molybdopterin-guanine dinucleotide biosynthesis protein A
LALIGMTEAPAGVILAGGRSSRMGGGDKTLLPLGSGTVLSAIIARFAPQVGELAINANGDPGRFAGHRVPVIADSVGDFPGPLAGILAAMDWARDLGLPWVVTVPGDTPFLPCDLVPRLLWAVEGGAPVAIAASGGVLHPTAGLWSVALRDDLAGILEREERKVRAFTARHHAAVAEFPATTPDPFFNINTSGDLAAAEGWM